VAEELRFFLRIALFAAAVGTIYWFVSYEIAGTILLIAIVAGAGVFLGTMARLRRGAYSDVVENGEEKEDGGPVRKAGLSVKRVVGFDDEAAASVAAPLEAEEEPVVHASAWPILTGVCGVLLGLGLLYGPWFWVPGLVLSAVVLWGWSSQLRS
jgi:hypothetical protein